MPFYNNTNIGGTLNSNHIYYNISVQNNNSGTADDGSEITTNNSELIYTFNESRAQPYLRKPSDYYLSVVRFTLESPNVPVFIVEPVVGQPDINKTIYTITFTDGGGGEFQESVKWIPDDINVPAPSSPVVRAYVSPSNPYYYCYSYQHFVDCINETFKTLAVKAGYKDYEAPYIYFDTNTKLFQLGGPVSIFRTKSDGSPLEKLSIYFNVPLLNLFSSLPAKYVANTASATLDQLDYLMILSTGSDVPSASPQPYVTNVRLNPLTSVNDVYAIQEYITLPLWCPITAIVFKTSLLTTAPELMATPVIYEDGNKNINAGKQNAEVLNIMVDYYSPLTDGTEYKPYIYYEPTGEYKLTDLYGREPVDAIDIQVYWRDNYGNLIPFYLGIGATSTLKILFRKKIFNSDKV